MSDSVPALLLLAALAPLAVSGGQPGGPQVEQTPFGMMPDGKTPITAYTLANRAGAKVKIIDYGGIVTELHVPDKDGKFADVVLGFGDLGGYLKGHPYFGANVGRCANRIAKGKFTLDGKEYTLATNNGPNHLHGGKEGFDKKVWRAETGMAATGPTLRLTYTSKDGEEGYPGTLSATVTYALTSDNELRIDFAATTDKPTVCNLAHHSYFNLAGHNAGDILGHEVQIYAARYTPADETLIPTGKIEPVANTPFDFTRPTAIGARLKEAGGKPVGYDLNYVLDPQPAVNARVNRGRGLPPAPAAQVTDPKSGRVLEVMTTEPGVQFYTGNFLDGSNTGKGGAVYKQYHGFCLEPQKFPDSVNKPDWKDLSNPVLRPGQEYRQTTISRSSVRK
jgi:aldose 1-epimerase